MQHTVELAEALSIGEDTNALLELIENRKKLHAAFEGQVQKGAKPKKGDTRYITLQLFKEGNKINNIAKMRRAHIHYRGKSSDLFFWDREKFLLKIFFQKTKWKRY